MFTIFCFKFLSEVEKAVISPVAVIAPVTAKVDPSNVMFASAFIPSVPVAVTTLLLEPLVMKSDTSTEIESAATSIPVPAPTAKEPDVVTDPVKPFPPVTEVTVPVFVVNPLSLLNPEILIFPFVSFFCALTESTTQKKSPSASEVEVASSDKSTLTASAVTSIKVPAPTSKEPDVVTDPVKPFPPDTEVTVPVFVVNPESLLKPEILILPLVNFFCAPTESTTAKKSPSASEVEVVNSSKSTASVGVDPSPEAAPVIPSPAVIEAT